LPCIPKTITPKQISDPFFDFEEREINQESESVQNDFPILPGMSLKEVQTAGSGDIMQEIM
jgi:hypothetical protein